MQGKQTLRPWVKLDRENKGFPGQVSINNLFFEEPCRLIAILGVNRDQLGLISELELQEDGQGDTVVAYLSEDMDVKGEMYRIVYVPPSKQDHESFQTMWDIIRSLSAVIVSDIYGGSHRLKESGREGTMHFVVVNQSDVYEAGVKAQKIQLVRKVETPLLGVVPRDLQPQNIQFDLLARSFRKYRSQWDLLVSGEMAWSFLNRSILQYYKSSRMLNEGSEKVREMREEDKMMSTSEIMQLQKWLISETGSSSIRELALSQQAVQRIIRQIREQNMSRQASFLVKLQCDMHRNFSSFEELSAKKDEISSILQSYGLLAEYSEIVVFQKEKQLFKEEISSLYSQKQARAVEAETMRQKIAQKNTQLEEYKAELAIYSDRLADLISLQQTAEIRERKFQQLQSENSQLRQLIDKLLTEDQLGKEGKEELEKVLEAKESESAKLLECLQQMAQKNTDLQTQNDQQAAELKELRMQVVQSCQIESRALRSIQNQSDVKVRLERYCNYVKELKTGLFSFKRLEVDKFNFILKQNQKQHREVVKQLEEARNEAQGLREANRTLEIHLQRQKHRMGYLQRFIGEGTGHAAIAELSEQESLTDRELVA